MESDRQKSSLSSYKYMNIKFNKVDFRTDLEDYFKLSGIREYKKLNHTPFIVFNGDKVELCFNANVLVNDYSPETNVLGQWKGTWNSNFFHFKVKDLIDYVKKNPQETFQII